MKQRRTAFVTMTALIDDVPDGMDEEAICQMVRDNVGMFSKNAFWSTEVIVNGVSGNETTNDTGGSANAGDDASNFQPDTDSVD